MGRDRRNEIANVETAEDVDVMKVEILLLKGQVKKERDRNTRLEQYTRRENTRLLMSRRPRTRTLKPCSRKF